MNKIIRCEGYRRKGGFLTFGPVVWIQCENEAVVKLKIKQEGKVSIMPSCMKCWEEAKDTKWKIKIIRCEPIKKEIEK